MGKQNFESIEGLRAYMAWWVVLGHAINLGGAPSWVPRSLEQLLARGETAVDIFIIISGFVITHLILTAKESYGPYIIRRFFRIAPIYFVCVALAILTMAYYREVYVDLPWSKFREIKADRMLETDAHWWSHIAAHATLLHGLIPESVLQYSGTSLLAPAWSLSLEWQFYLVAPAIVFLMGRSWPALVATVLVLFFAGMAANAWWRDDYQYPAMLLLSINYFLVGIGSRWLIEKMPPLNVGGLPFLVVLAALFTLFKSLALLVWTPFLLIAMSQSGKIKPFGKTANALVWVFAGNPLIRSLGKISYSTYLIHITLFCVVAHVWGRFFALTVQANLQAAIGVAIVLTPFVSRALYEGIERPFIAFGKKFSSRLRPPVAAVAA